MRLYVGDLEKKDIIKSIYNDMKDIYSKNNYHLPDLSNEQLLNEVNKDYISTINNVNFNLSFVDDYLEFQDSKASL